MYTILYNLKKAKVLFYFPSAIVYRTSNKGLDDNKALTEGPNVGFRYFLRPEMETSQAKKGFF